MIHFAIFQKVSIFLEHVKQRGRLGFYECELLILSEGSARMVSELAFHVESWCLKFGQRRQRQQVAEMGT